MSQFFHKEDDAKAIAIPPKTAQLKVLVTIISFNSDNVF